MFGFFKRSREPEPKWRIVSRGGVYWVQSLEGIPHAGGTLWLEHWSHDTLEDATARVQRLAAEYALKHGTTETIAEYDNTGRLILPAVHEQERPRP